MPAKGNKRRSSPTCANATKKSYLPSPGRTARDGLIRAALYPPELSRRLGDVIALMRDGRLWLNDAKDDYLTNTKFRATHGGLTAAEMFVPWPGVPL